MTYTNENGTTGVVAAIMIFIIMVVSAIGFIFISNDFNNQYNDAINDPVNSTGIFLNNTTPYEEVHTATFSFLDNIPTTILIALLLAALIVVLLVWAILKRES